MNKEKARRILDKMKKSYGSEDPSAPLPGLVSNPSKDGSAGGKNVRPNIDQKEVGTGKAQFRNKKKKQNNRY